MSTAYLAFEDYDHGRRFANIAVGIWPPPEKVWLLTLDFGSAVLDVLHEDELPRLAEHPFAEDGILEVTPFTMVRKSSLSDEIADSPFIARGALYLPSGVAHA